MTIITEQDFFQGYPPEKVYITSDLHLYHKNIIEYCNRPFDDCLKMTEFLLKKFDELPEDCLIWNFGDVYLNWSIEHSRIMNDVMRMKKNRRMCLILGNQDFQSNKKPFKSFIEFTQIKVLNQSCISDAVATKQASLASCTYNFNT